MYLFIYIYLCMYTFVQLQVNLSNVVKALLVWHAPDRGEKIP